MRAEVGGLLPFPIVDSFSNYRDFRRQVVRVDELPVAQHVRECQTKYSPS
jgi:hypothetical protein